MGPLRTAGGWPRAIVFDLDGTLVDSAPDIREAMNEAFGLLGTAPFTLAEVKTMIGGGAPAAIRRASELREVTLGRADLARVTARFYEVYAAASGRGQGLFPGAHELLGQLKSQGVALAICTNKAQAITDIAVEALGIAGYFGAIVGARDDLAKKPDPAPVRLALGGIAASADGALMIGDSGADIGAAKAAGLPSIAIAHGYAKVPVAELGADAVAADLASVADAIRSLGARR
jgi:phosphoglycolate phosphatase